MFEVLRKARALLGGEEGAPFAAAQAQVRETLYLWINGENVDDWPWNELGENQCETGSTCMPARPRDPQYE
eukprot:CAMPEP_0206278644 /NCGR_PEP_ID=MMETSP0047_2-20121206/37535_1 /ASSEMBLY_ACC=CAM_ASM_000192 /TAXON_ID=195065 /ORGANISM="Chroomonas mesostigmatica_cf, Strain CCMP1168" /LENGTH=70 /DNA_ID=CAMNT_0053708413 /DNA_START=158 /DNA_END=370 /DNA_ORIENTATION=-